MLPATLGGVGLILVDVVAVGKGADGRVAAVGGVGPAGEADHLPVIGAHVMVSILRSMIILYKQLLLELKKQPLIKWIV